MKLLIVDCDSTLSALEGIDELARLRGPEVFAQVEEATKLAMDGAIPLDSVFGRRLELIKPTRDECAAIGQDYIKHAVVGVQQAMEGARRTGWEILILSGGFVPCIAPLAEWLHITQPIEAVPLNFHADGSYAGFGEDYPTTRNGGKPTIIQELKAKLNPERVVMVGDGVSDLETKMVVNLFVGFGAVIARPKVQEGADRFIHNWAELAPILDDVMTAPAR